MSHLARLVTYLGFEGTVLVLAEEFGCFLQMLDPLFWALQISAHSR